MGNREKREEEAIKVLQKCNCRFQRFLEPLLLCLSGGQRQRVAIARLDHKAKIVNCGRGDFMLILRLRPIFYGTRASKQKRFAMLYITHDLHLARKVADKVWCHNWYEYREEGVSFEGLKTEHIYTK